jgi:hypothetical protein
MKKTISTYIAIAKKTTELLSVENGEGAYFARATRYVRASSTSASKRA